VLPLQYGIGLPRFGKGRNDAIRPSVAGPDKYRYRANLCRYRAARIAHREARDDRTIVIRSFIMRLSIIALSLLLAQPAALLAEPAAPAPQNLKDGRMVRTADGRRVGEIVRVDRDASGAPRGGVAIFETGSVEIPASTLTDQGRGLVTSLSYSDVAKLQKGR
jgi:hypothetical protein